MALAFDSPLALSALSIDWEEGSPTEVRCLHSMDADEWMELELPMTNGPVELNYLWLVFPEAEEGGRPGIRELHME